MLKKLIFGLLLALGISFSAGAQTNDVFKSFMDKTVFTFEEEFRLKDANYGPLFYEHSDIQIKYKLVDPYLDVFSDYRLIFQNKGKGWNTQSMFLEGFNLKYPEGKWGKINLRNRIEIGLNDHVDDTYQLNIFPKYNTPWKWTKFKINPFVANEMFFDTVHSMDFIKDRIYAGVDWQITPKIKGSTYYYKEENKAGSSWVQSDVAVTQIKFEF